MCVDGAQLVGANSGHVYAARVPVDRLFDFHAARALPTHPSPLVPLETSAIRWLD